MSWVRCRCVSIRRMNYSRLSISNWKWCEQLINQTIGTHSLDPFSFFPPLSLSLSFYSPNLSPFIEVNNMALEKKVESWQKKRKENERKKRLACMRTQIEMMASSFLMSCNFMILTSRKNISQTFDDQWRAQVLKRNNKCRTNKINT